MHRALAFLRWVLVGLVALLALGVALVLVLTRTAWGVERVVRYGIGALESSIHGRLAVGGIGSSSLLSGVTFRDVAITDSARRPFVRLDSMRARYDWRSLARGEIVLSRLELFRPRIRLEQLPGDTLWNFQRIFAETASATGPRRLVRLGDVTVHDGVLTIAQPYEQKGPIQPSDTARMLMERVPGGLQRLLRFDSLDAELPELLWSSPQEPGQLARVGRLSMRGYIWAQPFELRDAAGTVAMHDSVVAFDVARARLPATRGSILGRVIVHPAGNDYDVRIVGDSVAFADLRWLYPKLPREGGGTATLRMLSVHRGILWQVTDARLRAPGTAVAGSFGIVTGDTLYFTRVDLKASPFDLKLVQSMLPGKLPIQGLLVGTVVLQGPLSALETHGNLRLAGGAGASPSGVSWSGTVDLRRPFGARDFHADVDSLDLALLSAFDPGLRLRGAVSGRIDASGRLDRSVRLVADLHHALPGVPESRLTGSGDIAWSRRSSRFDLQLQAVPLALDALAQAFPALKRLEGSARGPVTVKGSLDDLHVGAELETPAGHLGVSGRFDLASRRPAFQAAGELTGFRLDRVIAGLPATTLTGRYRLDGAGRSLDDLEGTFGFVLTGGRVDGIPLRAGTARVSVQGGTARIDSLEVGTAAGKLTGRGSFGLAAGRSGRLELDVGADSLGALEPFVFADSVGAAPRLGGTLRLHATLTGGVDAFDVSAAGSLLAARYADGAAARATLRFTGAALASARPTWNLEADADTLRYGDFKFPAVHLRADYAASGGSVLLTANGADGGSYALGGDYRLAGDTLAAAVRNLRFGAGRSAWRLTAPAALSLVGHAVGVDSVVLARAGGGALRAEGRLAWSSTAAGAPVGFRLQLDHAPVEDFLGLAGAEPLARGRVTGSIQVDGTTRAPRIAGALAIDSARVGELGLDRVDARLDYADRRVQARVDGRVGARAVLGAEGALPLDLSFGPVPRRLPDEPIQGTLRADSLPASLLTTWLTGFSGVRGRLDGQVQVAGTARAPRFQGEIGLSGAGGSWVASGATYSDVQGRFRMEGDGAIRVDATARAGSGQARVGGQLVVGSDWTNPRFDLAAHLTGFQAARRRDVDMTASGDLHLGGVYRAPMVSGNLRVDRGVLNVDEIWRQYNIVALDDSLLFNVVDTSVASIKQVLTAERESDFMRNLTVSGFTLDVGRDAWLRGKQMNVEVSGNLGILYRRAADDLRLTGRLTAVRGNYLLYGGRRFDVKGGTVEFAGTTGLDPNLDITAVYKARTCETDQALNIQANVTGTLGSPRVALSSDASRTISQSDLVSCLVFGVPTYRLTPSQSRYTDLLAGAVTTSALGLTSSWLESMAHMAGLPLDYLALTTGETAPTDPSTSTVNAGWLAPIAGTTLDFGRYFGDRFFLAATVGRTTYGSTSLVRGAHLDWRIRPTWTGEFFWEDRAARMPSLAYTLDQTAAQKKVVGFFFYREWGY